MSYAFKPVYNFADFDIFCMIHVIFAAATNKLKKYRSKRPVVIVWDFAVS